jgi:hypothetical protein
MDNARRRNIIACLWFAFFDIEKAGPEQRNFIRLTAQAHEHGRQFGITHNEIIGVAFSLLEEAVAAINISDIEPREES